MPLTSLSRQDDFTSDNRSMNISAVTVLSLFPLAFPLLVFRAAQVFVYPLTQMFSMLGTSGFVMTSDMECGEEREGAEGRCQGERERERERAGGDKKGDNFLLPINPLKTVPLHKEISDT